MSAASRRRVGFPTTRSLFASAVLVIGLVSPAQATFLPPPWRLAILFDRPVWEPAAVYERRVPLRYGMEPLIFEERVHG